MEKITFDVTKLTKSDFAIYNEMTDAEKASFEKIWISIETQKVKLLQQKHATQERASREKKALAEKERKERNHRLIERGAILEAAIKNPTDFSNEEISEIIRTLLGKDEAKAYIEKIRSEKNGNTEIPETSVNTETGADEVPWYLTKEEVEAF